MHPNYTRLFNTYTKRQDHASNGPESNRATQRSPPLSDKFQWIDAVHHHHGAETYADEKPADGEHLPGRGKRRYEAKPYHYGEGQEVGFLSADRVRQLAK